jgi:hypothetical protein
MRVPVLAGILLVAACDPAPVPDSSRPDSLLVGSFVDDYSATHMVSAVEWRHGSRARYHIVKWNATDQYLIARNDSANPGDGGLWTRIDWLRLNDMAPWAWGFCMSAYQAPTADSAEATRVADRSTPRTGCHGFPFTRMRSNRNDPRPRG